MDNRQRTTVFRYARQKTNVVRQKGGAAAGCGFALLRQDNKTTSQRDLGFARQRDN